MLWRLIKREYRRRRPWLLLLKPLSKLARRRKSDHDRLRLLLGHAPHHYEPGF
jgi:hypothetical protein